MSFFRALAPLGLLLTLGLTTNGCVIRFGELEDDGRFVDDDSAGVTGGFAGAGGFGGGGVGGGVGGGTGGDDIYACTAPEGDPALERTRDSCAELPVPG